MRPRHREQKQREHVDVVEVPKGISMLTSFDMNDTNSGRIAFFKPQFETASVPDVDAGHWSEWQGLLRSRDYGSNSDASDAMLIGVENGFGTLSSALLALPSVNFNNRKPVWLFANGAPDEVPYELVQL